MKRLYQTLFLATGLVAALVSPAAPIEEKRLAERIDTAETRNTDAYRNTHPGSWTFNLDNDLFFPNDTDRDYTGGVTLRHHGAQRHNAFRLLERPLSAINDWLLGPRSAVNGPASNATEVGLYGFTPEDIETSDIASNDRPYASLLYYSNSATRVDWAENATWESSLTVGALGLNAFEGLQNQAHRVTNTARANGWDNQISNGGELTARYQLARQNLLVSSPRGWQLKSSRHLSLGYITEAGMNLSFRAGKFSTPWWSFNPDLATYGEQGGRVGQSAQNPGEQFFWGGVSIKTRAYNAFLQGQFRHSDHTLSGSELNHLLAEAWLGYTQSIGHGFTLSYAVRAQSSEIKNGDGDRHLFWGGFSLNKVL